VALGRELETDLDLKKDIDDYRGLIQSSRSDMNQAPGLLERFLNPKMITAIPVIALMVLLTALIFSFRPVTYSTDVGERQTVALEDKSSITLNTNTLLSVHYTSRQRLIHLQQGEAYFKVEHDPIRPFKVKAANGTVTALGTAFDVALDGDKVTVSVLEGTVAIESTPSSNHMLSNDRPLSKPVRKKLGVGESVNYWAAGILTDVKPANKQRIEAWREGKLNFDDLRLADAIKEHNRYTEQKIILGTEEVKDLSISGIFDIGDTESFLYLLEKSLGLQSIKRHNMIFLVKPTRSRMAVPDKTSPPSGSPG